MKKLLDSYNKEFYENQISGSERSAKLVTPIILDLFPSTSSIADIGCGAGTWLAEFKKLNIPTVHGYDGGSPGDKLLKIAKHEHTKIDFTDSLNLNHKFDLTICLEVAEHLEKSYSDKLIKELCKSSDIIIFSAAIPGQGGTNHINEQWPSYWREKFKENGFEFLDILRPQIWDMEDIEWWYRQNIFVAMNRTIKNKNNFHHLSPANEHTPIDFVHPEMSTRDRTSVVGLTKDIKALSNYNDKILNSLSWRLTSIIRKINMYYKKYLH